MTFKEFLGQFLKYVNQKKKLPKEIVEYYDKIYNKKVYLQESYKLPDFLFSYQVEGIKFALFIKRAALFWEQGLGKTLAGLSFAINSPQPVLVVTKKRIIPNWIEHLKYFESFESFESFKYFKLEIINYENLSKITPGKFKTIIFDESHALKNWKAKRTQIAFYLAQKAENVLLLSGTPITRNPIDLYTQMKILHPEIFGTKADFINRYVILDRSNTFPVGFKNLDKLYNRVKLVSQTLKKDDHLKLPEKVIEPIYLSRTEEQIKLQELLEKEWPNITNHLTLTLRLHQLTCGIYENNFVETEKINFLKDFLEENSEQVIIFYQFRKEGDLIENLLKELKVTYTRVEANMKGNIEDFKQKKIQCLLGNIFSISEGLNLQNCNQAIYFSLPWSYKDYAQSLDRMHRPGQDKTVFINILITKNTIEEEIYKALSKKEDFAVKLFKPV